MMNPLERRRLATQATVDKFGGHPFEWGRYDCAKMLAFQLRGLRRPIAHAKAGSYSSAVGASRAIRRMGFENMSALMDAHFEAIAPAACLLGDIIEFQADNPLGALGVALGNNAVFCYSEEVETGPVSARIHVASRAWRII